MFGSEKSRGVSEQQSKPDDIRQMIRALRPQLIVNAAGYTAADQAEREEATAEALNAIAPAIIAQEAKKIGALLVHYSTDYDGAKKTPYVETDLPDSLSVYRRTKLAGEIAIQQSEVPHLIFRTGGFTRERAEISC